MKLPNEILTDYKNFKKMEIPQLTARALSDIEEHIGETFILADSEHLVCYSGKIGEPYKRFDFSFDHIQKMEINKERPFVYLKFNSAENSIRLKFAIFDLAIIRQILELSEAKPKDPPDPDANTQAEKETPVSQNQSLGNWELTPYVGFCSVLHALIHSDETMSTEESKKLQLIVSHSETLKQGRNLWKEKGTNFLLTELPKILSEQQKMCLLANLIELAMIDGILHEKEKRFIERFRVSFQIEIKTLNSMFDILLTKNNLSIF